MENHKNYNEERFDSFLNKTIIYSSKAYFKKQMKQSEKEKIIVNDENYAAFLEKYIAINEENSFIDSIDLGLQLNNALESLSAIEQSVIFLLFKEELNQEDAAKILEICSKSVSRIKLRAISKLKKYLKEDVENEE